MVDHLRRKAALRAADRAYAPSPGTEYANSAANSWSPKTTSAKAAGGLLVPVRPDAYSVLMVALMAAWTSGSHGHALICCRSLSAALISILRSLACSATGIRKVRTPAS
jgi:hypothetical protein